MKLTTGQKQYTGLSGRILNFLGNGFEPARVASAVGCEPSYISQLLSDQDFADQVQARRLDALQAATERDDRLNGLEDTLITRTEALISQPFAFTKPMEAIRALHMVNGLKRRGAGADQVGGNVTNNTVVTLVLPEVTMGKFTVDINNQVVQAGNQTLVTMGSGSIAPLASSVLPTSSLANMLESAQSSLTNQTNSIERNSTHEYLNKNYQDFPVPANIA